MKDDLETLRLWMKNKLDHDPTLSPTYRESVLKMLDHTIQELEQEPEVKLG